MIWPLVQLGDVAPAKASKHTFAETDDVWTLNLDQIEADTGKVLQKIIAPASESGSSTHGFDERHVLYSKLRPYLNKVVLPNDKGLATTELVPMLPDADRLERKYLAYYLRSKGFVDWVSAQVAGAKMPRVSMQLFWQHEIPLPPMPEQKRITAILDKADAIRRKRQQAIQLADDFLRAVFLDMFGDPGANPKGFIEAVLGELTTGKMNNGLFRKNDEYGGSVPVAWVGELFRGNRISFSEDASRIEPTEKEIDAYGLKYGDLLFCRSSLKLEGIGFNNIYLGDDDNALFECHLIRMSPCLEKVNPVFLNYQLRMPSVRARIFQQAKTSTMTTIDQAGLSRIKVFVPPLDLQEEFERRLIKVESLYSHLYKNKSLDELVFSSISQKAFSGQL